MLVRDRLIQEPEEEGKHWRFTGVLYDYIRSCLFSVYTSLCVFYACPDRKFLGFSTITVMVEQFLLKV